jgi:hypothetical protein
VCHELGISLTENALPKKNIPDRDLSARILQPRRGPAS